MPDASENSGLIAAVDTGINVNPDGSRNNSVLPLLSRC